MHANYMGALELKHLQNFFVSAKHPIKKTLFLQVTLQGMFLFPFISLANLSTKDYQIKKEEQKARKAFAPPYFVAILSLEM